MISERQAIMMIEDELQNDELKNLHKKQLFQFIQAYAQRICRLGEEGSLKKFETQLIVANRLYTEGTDDVKEVMESVYISLLSHTLELRPELLHLAEKNLSRFLLKVMNHNHLADHP